MNKTTYNENKNAGSLPVGQLHIIEIFVNVSQSSDTENNNYRVQPTTSSKRKESSEEQENATHPPPRERTAIVTNSAVRVRRAHITAKQDPLEERQKQQCNSIAA